MTVHGAIDMHSHYYGGLVDDLLRRDARPFVTRQATECLRFMQ